ncbi:MAG: dephospho-CoA kinase [Pseudomonadales bacterium]|nr:dephospho-CoA kinase [Pseudomonadales bacterium]
MTLVIGLTGGIGSGKTAVSDRFENLDITIADADIAARTVVEPGTEALTKISSHFGDDILCPDGSLNRPAMRNIVFADKSQRRWLESVTVPAILAELRQILDNAKSPYAMLMLSSGNGQSPWIDRHLVVDVPVEVQIERVMSRDSNTREQIEAIIQSQLSREQRLTYADDIIRNDTGLEQLDIEIKKLHQRYLKLAADAS